MAKLDEITQEELDRMEKALDRYKKENERFRNERDEFKSAAENNEANAKLRERVLKAEAAAKLSATGVKGADRFSKYIDFSKLEIDDEGNVSGLDDQLENIKNDFSEVFDPKRRVGGLADVGNKPAGDLAPKSVTDLQLEAIFNK
jgi:hypothetical protein